MAGLDQAQWARAMALFDEAIEWPPAERDGRLRAAETDAAVRDEVSSLLAASGETKGFFSRPISAEGIEALADLPSGARVGSWRIVRIIGRGGMGAVYEAARAEGGFDQRAALKVIGIEASAYLGRFEDERAIVARLDHPGIARLYDGGLDADAHPFMAMELVDGRPLTEAALALPLRARLQLFVEACDAVAYAHRNLVIHLDIKPGNVLVTPEGAPKLLDFGAARVLEAGLPEGAAAAMLTPAYAAPEQVAGRPVTTATDVYALGRLLAELGGSDASGGDLAAITDHATRLDPAARYANAGALAADVRRHLGGEPVTVRSGSRLYVAGRTLRRYRWAAAAAVLIVAALGAGLIGTAVEARRAIAERDHFESEAARGDAALDYFTLMFRTAGEDAGDKPVTANAVLAQSAASLDRQFAGEPAKYGRVVEFLANLYSELTDETGSETLERRYLASTAASADPVTAGRVRLMLAQSLLRQGRTDESAKFLHQAQAFWNSDAGRYEGEMSRSRIVEGQLDKAAGDLPDAIASFRRGIAEATRPDSTALPEDLANLRNSLALALMADSQFTEARALMDRLRQYREHEGRISDSLLTTIQNQGAIALAMGDLPRAASLLRQSIDLRRARMGPSGSMAAAELNLSRTLLLEGRPDAALSAATDAEQFARRFTGDKSPLTIGGLVMIAAADASLKSPAAAAAADAARLASSAKPDALHALSLAVDARNAANSGRAGVARADYDEGARMLTAAGKPGLLARPLFNQIASPDQPLISR